MRTFARIKKQVDDRVKHSRPRGGIHVAIHDIQVYLLELKAFHVKHYAILQDEDALAESEKELLAAGEHFEEACKTWLAGK